VMVMMIMEVTLIDYRRLEFDQSIDQTLSLTIFDACV